MRRKMFSLCLGTSLCTTTLLFATPVFATHPLGTEEPGTVAPRAVEAEATYELNHYGGDEGGNQGEADLWVGTGIIKDLDVGVTLPFIHVTPDEGDSEAGLGDIEVTVKWNFLKPAEQMPGMAVKAGVALPTGDEDKGLGNGTTQLSLTFLAEKELKPVDLYLNAGVARLLDAEEGMKANTFMASVAAQWEFIEKFTAVGEVMFESVEEDGGDPSLTATAGAVWQITDNLGIDAGLRIGLTDAAPDWSILAGVNFSFGEAEGEAKEK